MSELQGYCYLQVFIIKTESIHQSTTSDVRLLPIFVSFSCPRLKSLEGQGHLKVKVTLCLLRYCICLVHHFASISAKVVNWRGLIKDLIFQSFCVKWQSILFQWGFGGDHFFAAPEHYKYEQTRKQSNLQNHGHNCLMICRALTRYTKYYVFLD